jgi:uncharacterized membrane protein (DUF106 family)
MADAPLPSKSSGDTSKDTDIEAVDKQEASEEGEEGEETEGTEEGETEAPKPAVPEYHPPQFKISTFILVFLFFMGFWMLIDQAARNQIAQLLGLGLYPVFGFSGRYPLLTMFIIGLLQMTISAIAYNWTTDWVESAKVQQHAKALRPLQMSAMRSGKKQHMEAIKPHMNDLSSRQSKMMIGQLKAMAVTWFLLIAIYTWVGLFLVSGCPQPAIAPSATSIATSNPSFVLNATVNGGTAPYTYEWWATGIPNSASVPPPNETWPSGPSVNSIVFRPTVAGSYTITLKVIDARGNVGTGFQGLQYASNLAPPSVTIPTLECGSTSVVLFGTSANLLGTVVFPLWFIIFSLYTIPFNLLIRRLLKHQTLSKRLDEESNLQMSEVK